MDFTSKYLGKDDPVTEGVIRELHKVTVKGVRGGQAKDILMDRKPTYEELEQSVKG